MFVLQKLSPIISAPNSHSSLLLQNFFCYSFNEKESLHPAFKPSVMCAPVAKATAVTSFPFSPADNPDKFL